MGEIDGSDQVDQQGSNATCGIFFAQTFHASFGECFTNINK